MSFFDAFKSTETRYAPTANVFRLKPSEPEPHVILIHESDRHDLNTRKLSYYTRLANAVLSQLTVPRNVGKDLINNAAHHAVEMEHQVAFLSNEQIQNTHEAIFRHTARDMGLDEKEWNNSEVTDPACDSGMLQPFYVANFDDHAAFFFMGLTFESMLLAKKTLEALVGELRRNGSIKGGNQKALLIKHLPKLDELKEDIDKFKHAGFAGFLEASEAVNRPRGFRTPVSPAAFTSYYRKRMLSLLRDLKTCCEPLDGDPDVFVALATSQTEESIFLDAIDNARLGHRNCTARS